MQVSVKTSVLTPNENRILAKDLKVPSPHLTEMRWCEKPQGEAHLARGQGCSGLVKGERQGGV